MGWNTLPRGSAPTGTIYFVTGNGRKFQEVAAIVPNLEQLAWDLPEIQEVDPRPIIEAKLRKAAQDLKEISSQRQGLGCRGLIVEDTSLHLYCLGALPGPLIKWFLKTLGNDGLYGLCCRYGNYRAVARTVIGFSPDGESMMFFEGTLAGRVVAPRGDKDFGWGPVFQPMGYGETFGEMERDAKQSLSMRGEAARRLVEYLKG